jgi:hypothetical protein
LVFERVFVILILLLADVELFFADDEGAETEFVEPVGDSNIDILSDMGFLLTLFILAMALAYLFSFSVGQYCFDICIFLYSILQSRDIQFSNISCAPKIVKKA